MHAGRGDYDRPPDGHCSAANHSYWDPAYRPDLYSNVKALNQAGYATSNLDPVGSGQSSQPLSAFVTADAFVYQVHRVIELLRSGAIGGVPFTTVVAHGLSNGSMVAAIEAGRYGDVDALVLTGFTGIVTPEAAIETMTVTHPAFRDDRYADRDLDPGSIAFGDLFYEHTMVSAHDYEPAAIDAAKARPATSQPASTWQP